MSNDQAAPGIGTRRRVEIAGETYYIIATREPDGALLFSCTVPDENSPTGRMRRLTADRTCEVLSEMATELITGRGKK